MQFDLMCGVTALSEEEWFTLQLIKHPELMAATVSFLITTHEWRRS